MGNSLRDQVQNRAGSRCEYCRIPCQYDEAVFCLDHITARKHHGPTHIDNLALACYWCNSYKGDNLTGIDPLTGEITRLFHPRRDDWRRHFVWEGPTLAGLTEIGRATIDVLCINAAVRIELRSILIGEGVTF
jgi:hypothetical protein